MADLPVMLRIAGRRCLVVGGGPVGLRRAKALLDAGAIVTVVAPEAEPELAKLPLRLELRAYSEGDVAGALLVVIATDDPAVNQRIADDAKAAGALVNRADDPATGDVSIPAHARHGPVTVAVHTGGVSAAAAAAIRRELSAALDADWVRLLEAAAPFRAAIQAQTADPAQRRERLARLTGPEAMRTLKEQGAEALERFCRSLLPQARLGDAQTRGFESAGS